MSLPPFHYHRRSCYLQSFLHTLEKEYIYTKNEFENLKNKTAQAFYQPCSLITNYQYECLVDIPETDFRRGFSTSFEDKLMSTSIIDTENEITYSFKEASD